ncbi:MAG: formate dehydrogenase accessory sulfurtransferase FdhD [Alphaproteobacteria bacterium]|nr:formate dehydrogenase accessory sulfurtransferase FdhD [Alphaproteobacteria bacterium]
MGCGSELAVDPGLRAVGNGVIAVEAGVRTAPALQLSSTKPGRQAPALVIHEDVLTIDVEEVGSYSLMWTPTRDTSAAVAWCREDGILTADAIAADGDQVPEALALAAGFAFTEGIVSQRADISTMAVCPERPDVVRMRLSDPEAVVVRRRNVVMNSSCGVCGGREQIERRAAAGPVAAASLNVSVGELSALTEALRARQQVFARTGGAHGAAIFDRGCRIVAVAEDLGRHNALDKVIGQRFLEGSGFAGCAAVITSRISYEMVAKAARAGLELVAAISAPSSLAIDMAERAGITLCGFVRGGCAEVYTHGHRVAAA